MQHFMSDAAICSENNAENYTDVHRPARRRPLLAWAVECEQSYV